MYVGQAEMRVLPSDLDKQLTDLCRAIDQLSGLVMSLPVPHQQGAFQRIRDLNVKLCNQVIAVSAESTDEEVRKKLAELMGEALSIREFFTKQGVVVAPTELMERFGTGSLEISRPLAGALVQRFDEMEPVFKEARSRVPRVFSASSISARLPFTGPAITLMVEEIGDRMGWLDKNYEEAAATSGRLAAQLTSEKKDIPSDLGEVQRLRSWITSVFYLDNKLKRLESAVLGEKHAVTVVTPVGWALMGVGALGLGYVLYRLTGGGS